MRKAWLASAALAIGLPPAHGAEWVIEARYDTEARLEAIAGQFQHLIIDRERQTVRVDVDDAGVALLQDAGLDVRIDMVATARMREAQLAMARPAGTEAIPGFACYRTVEETRDTVDALALSHPGLVAIDELGPSWERSQNASAGYAMRALRITNLATAAANPDRPKMISFGSIHAREYTPAELLTRMAEWLVNGYGSDATATWLVDHVDFRFVLHANPDGRKKAETGISWRKNINIVDAACAGTPTSSSHPGVDLNRNFPFHWNTTMGTGSSGTKCNATYRGASAGSEVETQNLVRYVAGTKAAGVYSGGMLPDRRGEALSLPAPDDYAGLFFDIHSFSRLVLWSWGDVTGGAPNNAALTAMGRRLAFFNGYKPQQSVQLYATDGTTVDTMYGELGAPSFTIELGDAFFENCTTFTNTTYPVNLAALKYAARVAWRPYQLPLGPDVSSIVAPATVEAGTPLELTALIDDSRYNQSNGTQATFAISAANAWIDQAPWDAGAIAIALAASDGSFNTASEAVRGSIPTSSLAPGKHLLYVQGVNTQASGGRAGAPDAVFFTVLAPGDALFADGFDAGLP